MRVHKENYNLIGAASGLLTVVADSGKVSDRREHLWLCQCACGNPQLVPVPTKDLLGKHKKSCGCLKRRYKNPADHMSRGCREAVSLALYWAPRWGHDLYVQYGRQGRFMDKEPFYTVTPDKRPRFHVQLGYRVTPKGEVKHYPGYPDYATLFGRPTERIYLQFRRKEPPSDWITYGDNFEVFWAHQRALAEQRVRELNETNPGFEHRIKES
jgi:hypothetical protein